MTTRETMSEPVRPLLPLWPALIVALGSGPVMDAGFPDRGVWPLTFVGIALVLVTLVGRRNGSALLVGFVAGVSFYLVHIEWASLFLGLLPMAALAVLESLFFALGALAITLAYRWVPRAWPGVLGRAALVPVVIAGLWTAREAWASVWPYGGFAWGRVALSQSESPFASLFSLLGISGVSFVMVFIVAACIELARLSPASLGYTWIGRTTSSIARVCVAVALVMVVLLIPAWPVTTQGDMRVAAVQGNGKAGYFDAHESGDLLRAQVDATLPLIDDPDLGDVDVVLWPEDGAEFDPSVDGYTADTLDYLSDQLGAPIVTGAITQRGDKYYNTSLLWKPGEGAVDLYDKKHPVPFGEYIPDRAFWRPFAPDLIDLVQREYTPGTTDTVMDIDGIIAGINICFDISDDQVLTDSVREGAQIIFAQSNNADFGRTDESVQQLAIARIRAMELGRSVVNISTVGTSAIILADGSTLDQLEWYTPGTMVDDVPLSDTVTPAVVLGRHLEWFVSWLSLLTLVLAGFAARRDARTRPGSVPRG